MATDSQRVAVVPGASSGVGTAVAKALARQGWRVIGTGRDRERSAAAEAEIREVSSSDAVDMIRGDLSLLAGAECFASEVMALTDRIDVLVNNAGGMAKEKIVTREGHEVNFAANHLGSFLLTKRLLQLNAPDRQLY